LLLGISFQSFLEIVELVAVRREHAELFPPKIGWRIIFFVAGMGTAWVAIVMLPGIRITSEKGLELPVLIIVMLWFFRPKTLAINGSGLTFYRFYGLKGSFISWDEVARVASRWEDAGDRNLWAMLVRSPTVTVTGRDGTTVKFSYTNEGIGRFMDALRERVPRSAFDEGLYDWKP
jgi:hypothetical protein